MGTSARKLRETYDEKRDGRDMELGLQAYAAFAASQVMAPRVPRGATADDSAGEDDRADAAAEQPVQRGAAAPHPPAQSQPVQAPSQPGHLALATRPTRASRPPTGAPPPRAELPMAALLAAAKPRPRAQASQLALDISPFKRKQGAQVKYFPGPGKRHLTEEEVEELEEQGGVPALKAAFQWSFGKQAKSGNTKWLRRRLQGL
jgi:hypothetical protein